MKRRTKWIVGLAVGIPGLIVGGLLLFLVFLGSGDAPTLSSVEQRDLPQDWLTPPSIAEEEDLPEDRLPEPSDGVPEPPTLVSIGLPLSGILAIEGNGRRFGEEEYSLRVEENAVILQSDGEFRFKVLVATIRAEFDQRLELDASLRPKTLSSSFHAPLGFDRTIGATVGESRVTTRSGDEEREFSLQSAQVFVLNTFSTYAVIPLLFVLNPQEETMLLETLMLGGPPREDDDPGDRTLPVMRVDRTGDAILRFNEQEIAVSRYELSSETGSMFLYARGAEFLGLYADDGEQSLFVYRADFFPDGFEVVEDGDR